MSTQADIKSVDTLAFVKEAVIAYAHGSGQALADIEIEGQRGIDYITVDRAGYWKAEIRRAAEAVNQAIKDLEYCKAYKKVGDNTSQRSRARASSTTRTTTCEHKRRSTGPSPASPRAMQPTTSS